MPKPTVPEEDHDLHGEWSSEALDVLKELEICTNLGITLEAMQRNFDEAELRLMARLVFVPKHELVALRMEMRSRVEGSRKAEKAARQA